MSTDDPRRPKTPRITTSTLLGDLLKGQPCWSLPEHTDVDQIAAFMEMCRPRFDVGAAMLLVALQTKLISEPAKVALLNGLKEFVTAKGEKLVIVATDKTIENTIKLRAHQAGIKDIVVVTTVDAGSRMCSEYRAAVLKRPPLKP